MTVDTAPDPTTTHPPTEPKPEPEPDRAEIVAARLFTSGGDADPVRPPSELEQRLRELLPPHTYFDTGRIVQGVTRGQVFVTIVDDEQREYVDAAWSTPTGVWEIEAKWCCQDPGVYCVEVSGPGTEIERSRQSVDQIVALIVATCALS